MSKVQRQQIEITLRKLSEAELTVAGFYKLCARMWPTDGSFWLDLEHDELNHARYLGQIADRFDQQSDEFTIKRAFKVEAIHIFIEGIKTYIQRFKDGEITRANIFFIASIIEQSLLEFKYREFLKSSNEEYQRFIELIETQTVMHRNKIDEKIESVKKLQK